ncbi:nitrile hydratase subunit alpha [Nonomuraea sp. FMUSA5-5]|uniref:Nitrile hydratase subunit alpha n=1 Tax=Nonomuraea composti TaxID=2720023 RepID=A0ABX1AT27_9ACTN|nr:nitrile hydratase subunit alpha [Nonomuraea sp. FMUSA5-5]NJP88763.1 nitrile hydratase subunit alpha [Nonomuraea sp. FMUSA5-5]
MTATTDRVLDGDRAATIMAMVTARAWRDPEYKDRLLREPAAVLTEEGLDVPEGIELRVLEDTPAVRHVNLAREAGDVRQVIGGLPGALEVPEGGELRMVRNSEHVRYIVLRTPPAGIDPAMTSEATLSHHTAPFIWAVEAVVVGSTVSIVAEVVGAVVLT